MSYLQLVEKDSIVQNYYNFATYHFLGTKNMPGWVKL